VKCLIYLLVVLFSFFFQSFFSRTSIAMEAITGSTAWFAEINPSPYNIELSEIIGNLEIKSKHLTIDGRSNIIELNIKQISIDVNLEDASGSIMFDIGGLDIVKVGIEVIGKQRFQVIQIKGGPLKLELKLGFITGRSGFLAITSSTVQQSVAPTPINLKIWNTLTGDTKSYSNKLYKDVMSPGSNPKIKLGGGGRRNNIDEHITGYWSESHWRNVHSAEDGNWSTSADIGTPNKRLYANHSYNGNGKRNWQFKYSSSGSQYTLFQCYNYNTSEWTNIWVEKYRVSGKTVAKPIHNGCLKSKQHIQLRIHSASSARYFEGYIRK